MAYSTPHSVFTMANLASEATKAPVNGLPVKPPGGINPPVVVSPKKPANVDAAQSTGNCVFKETTAPVSPHGPTQPGPPPPGQNVPKKPVKTPPQTGKQIFAGMCPFKETYNPKPNGPKYPGPPQPGSH